MKRMPQTLALTAAGLLLSSCLGNGTAPTATVFHNADIITMDGAYDPAKAPEAFRVEDGRITAIGALDDLSAGAKKIDLKGAAVIPGVVDSHVHIRELGMDAIKVDLVGARTMEEIVARIRDQRSNVAPGEWIIGQGWDEGRFADYDGTGTYPDAGILSDAFPDNPVGLESLHGFGGMANQAAMEIAGIDANTPDPQGGTILRREDGSPTGVLLMLAQRLVFDQKPEPT